MSKITSLYPAQPNQETIHYLEQLLQQAKEGKLQTIAATGLLVDNAVISCLSNPVQPFVLLGALKVLSDTVSSYIE